ncbi:MAG: CPBP family intramembrane glutamic endopeptidase [Promethearchaeia archaeon]
MQQIKDPKKEIVKERFSFLIEVILVFLGIVILMLIPRYLLTLIVDSSSDFYGPLFYILRALAIFIAIPIFLYIPNLIFEANKKNLILEEDVSPSLEHLRLYSFKKINFKEQLTMGIIILFLLFIPLDFLIYYFFPETIEYTASALLERETDTYIAKEYLIFLISVIIIQFSVAIYEESLSRGFVNMRGASYYNKMSAVIIASFQFGLMHFAILPGFPIWLPIIWVLQAFIVGIILSIIVQKKKVIFPVIFAHALNNIISAHTLWNYLQGNDFIIIAIYLYLPLLIISIVILILKFSTIKTSIISGINFFKSYAENDKEINESKSDKYFRIFFDFLFAGLLFLVGVLFSI